MGDSDERRGGGGGETGKESKKRVKSLRRRERQREMEREKERKKEREKKKRRALSPKMSLNASTGLMGTDLHHCYTTTPPVLAPPITALQARKPTPSVARLRGD